VENAFLGHKTDYLVVNIVSKAYFTRINERQEDPEMF